jgi:hypothetical protein
MSGPGQKRRFDQVSPTSGAPRETDILKAGVHVSRVPQADDHLIPYSPTSLLMTSPNNSQRSPLSFLS